MSGLTDWHSHILPGVDDGVRQPEETERILARYARLGVRRLWLTPHVMEDVPNAPDALRKRFHEVFPTAEDDRNGNPVVVWRKSGIDDTAGAVEDHHSGIGDIACAVEIRLAAENMLDSLFDLRLEAGEVLPIGSDRDHLLVETSYFTPPRDFTDKLRRTFAAGFYPILAHPERYVYMEHRNYVRLLDMGVKFQLNLYSLTGMYGRPAAEKAAKLLSDGAYSLAGTDTHRLSQFEKALAAPVLSSSQISAIEKLKETDCL